MGNRVSPEQVAAIRHRVQEAFGELRKIGFIAKSNFSCCMSCAVAELSEFAGKRRRNRAVYWHRQDEEHFRKTAELFLRFCYLPPKGIEGETTALETQIGEQVAAALRIARLDIDWNGKPNTSIRIVGIASAIEQPNGKEVANGPDTTI